MGAFCNVNVYSFSLFFKNMLPTQTHVNGDEIKNEDQIFLWHLQQKETHIYTHIW